MNAKRNHPLGRILFFFVFCVCAPRPTWGDLSLTDYGAVPPLTRPDQDQMAGNQRLNYHTDLHTGRFNYTIPIQVPPARQGTQPNMALDNNSPRETGWGGVGWARRVPNIRRATSKGFISRRAEA